MNEIKVFAPASIGNIGPGFDVLGLALSAAGDVVEARRISGNKIIISEITGAEKDLPYDADKNTAGIAAKFVLSELRKKGIKTAGIELKLNKGIPAGSGLGSSAASAVAAGYAINLLYGNRLTKHDLIIPITKAEAAVSGGFFADNTAASLFGGAILCRSYNPLDIFSIGSIPELQLAVVKPAFSLLTRKARAILPKKIRMENFITNLANSCSIVAAFAEKDINLLSRSIDDKVIEPYRAKLIPGFYDVKNAALENGALGCSISGAGPSIFAVAESPANARKIGRAMQIAFKRRKIKSSLLISEVDEKGSRKI